MQDSKVRLLRSMLEAYSPSGSEEDIADLLRTEMTSLGFKAHIDEGGNVIGDLGEAGPRILLCGHLDTVPGWIPVRLENGMLYGRGAVDAKSSLAAMILGCSQAAESPRFRFRATVAGVVEEETSSSGIKSLIPQAGQFDLAVFGEPSGVSNIIIGYKGCVKLDITCKTRGGHSSSPWLSANSLEEAFNFWNRLRDTIMENDAPSKFSTVTGSLTRAAAGGLTSTIPSKATLQADIRVPPTVDIDHLIARIEDTRASFQQERSGVCIAARILDQTLPYVGDPDSVAIRAFRRAIRKVIGSKVTLVKKTGTSDMNILARATRIPMIAYGPGDSTLDHTDTENVRLDDYAKSIEVYSAGIERFASLFQEPAYLPTVVG